MSVRVRPDAVVGGTLTEAGGISLIIGGCQTRSKPGVGGVHFDSFYTGGYNQWVRRAAYPSSPADGRSALRQSSMTARTHQSGPSSQSTLG